MNFPAELRYTQDHEWIRIEDDGTAVIGITEFAQNELGDIIYIDVNTVGQSLAKGEVFGAVEAVKTVSDLFLPIEGEVLELNPAIEKNPELLNSDPYGQGWIIRLKPTITDVNTDSHGSGSTSIKKPAGTFPLEGLLTADAYRELVGV